MTHQLPPGPRQLPAGSCIRHAITSVRNNIAYAFRISWPWYAVLALVSIVAVGLIGYFSIGNPNPGLIIVVAFAFAFISLVSFASIAVNWHRYILLDEVPLGSEIFRLDDKTWRYLGNLVLIFLILFGIGLVVMVPVAALTSLSSATAFVGIIIALIALPYAAIASLRMCIKLPAIAVGRRDFLLKDAWAATQGNNLPLFLIFLFQIALVIAAFLVLALLEFISTNINPTLGLVVSVLFQLGINWVLTIFGITLLTSLYGFFIEQRDF